MPEQQSEPVVQSSHSLRQPPEAAQRLVPSPVVRQTREQHCIASLQTSPTCREHARRSFAVHAASAVQRRTPVASAAQRFEQQSFAVVHVSPSGRQPCRSWHVAGPSLGATQMRPQHSVSSVHASPAGLQPGASAAHVPPAQWFVQHSTSVAQFAPVAAHALSPAHRGAAPGSETKHPFEQHAPARVHALAAPRHPVAGRHVVSSVEADAQ
jgi:hypothetical protein